MELAYAAIGRAVIAMQMFEVAFVSIHEGFKMITDSAYLHATGGLIAPEKYKTASANVVKVLSGRGQIAADLEDRLNTLIERRHDLMHRWFLQKGWPAPDDNDPANYAEVIQLARWVSAEASSVTHQMTGYFLRHASPDAYGEDPDASIKAIREFFHRVHAQK